MDDSKINFDNVLALLNLARDSPDNSQEEISQSTPMKLRSAPSKLLDQGITAIKNAYDKVTNAKASEAKQVEQESATTVINCLVKVMTGMYKTLAEHGSQIKDIFEKIAKEKHRREELFGEIQKRYDEMEKKDREEVQELIRKQCDLSEKVLEKKICEEIEIRNTNNIASVNEYMKEQKEVVAKMVETKLDDLEKKCDEGRQREMKGTLIISSPETEQLRTEAVPRRQQWDENTFGKESELDMVLRMIYEKTGVWIPYEDVSACHRFGKAKNNSFVLRVWNWKPCSAWDELSWGMRTGQGFSNKNIFINFMLTERRTELSKQVRQAKKDKLIGKYSIDQNGKIFVKPVGSNTNFKLVSCVDDLDKLKKNFLS